MEEVTFLQSHESSELQIAKEFLTNWLPFLTKDLCEGCDVALLDRIQELKSVNERNLGNPEEEKVRLGAERLDLASLKEASDVAGGFDGYFRASPEGWEHIKATGWDTDPAPVSPKVCMSWDDMVQQDHLEEEQEEETRWDLLDDGMEEGKEEVGVNKRELSREHRELISFTSIGRKKDFVCLERIDGRIVNILEGLELHTGVFSAVEQKKIVDLVYELQKKGKNNELGEHTYSEESDPRKYMRGKGHALIQFGCYNYMEDNKITSGIIHDMVAHPLPNIFKAMIKRLIGWHVMPPSCVPDSCRVNIYEPGDFAPPNIDSLDLVRPFCTVSFLNECNIKFGSNLKEVDTGEFIGSSAIPVPVGSVLVLNGKGANVAKHAVSAAPSKRISIAFWKMEKNKLPLGFIPEPDLQNIQPYNFGTETESHGKTNEMEPFVEIRAMGSGREFNGRSNGARVRQNSKKVGGCVFDRLTPTKKSSHPTTDANSSINHNSIERSRDSRAFLRDHCGVPDEAEELPARSQNGWMKDDVNHFDRNDPSSERSVRIEQKRIIITRNLSRENDSYAGMTSQTNPHSQIRTFKNNRRRARMIQ